MHCPVASYSTHAKYICVWRSGILLAVMLYSFKCITTTSSCIGQARVVHVCCCSCMYMHLMDASSSLVSHQIRIEKLVKLHGNNLTSCCLNALHSMIQSIKKRYGPDTKFLVITDISPYGTDSCGNDGCMLHAKAAIEQIKELGLQPTHFEPRKYSKYVSSSVASIVESEALSRGKSLMTVGTGLFQTALINQFLTYQFTGTPIDQRISEWLIKSRHVYTVCRSSLTLPSSVLHPQELKRRITRSTSCLQT